MSIDLRLERIAAQLSALALEVTTIRAELSNPNQVRMTRTPAPVQPASMSEERAVISEPEAETTMSYQWSGRGGGRANKYWVVIRARPGCESNIGIYNRYTLFADQVRDPSKPWNGRGKIHFDSGTESQAFPLLADAEEYWCSHYPGPPLTARRWWV